MQLAYKWDYALYGTSGVPVSDGYQVYDSFQPRPATRPPLYPTQAAARRLTACRWSSRSNNYAAQHSMHCCLASMGTEIINLAAGNKVSRLYILLMVHLFMQSHLMWRNRWSPLGNKYIGA